MKAALGVFFVFFVLGMPSSARLMQEKQP